MRIVFMGTPQFSVPSLGALVAAGHEVCAVVTQPDRPNKRGNKVEFSAVKQAALSLGLEVLQPQKVSEVSFVEKLRQLAPDVIIVVAFGQILTKEILDLPKYGCINLHASLLPKYRGAAPIHWSVIDGQVETGNTTMLMNEGLDTGDMLLVNKVAIGSNETTGELHDKLSTTGAQLLVETLQHLNEGTLVATKQDDNLSTYASKLNKDMELLDWTLPSQVIFNKIRGMNPYPGAYTISSTGRLKIFGAKLVADRPKQNVQAGQIVEMTPKGFLVATGDGVLEILEVQPESRKRMTADNYVKGYKITSEEKLGDKLNV